MKVYISADIEGVAGITNPDEANPEKADIAYFQEQMTLEVAAAAEGAVAAGAKEVWVKDAHWTGRNINPRRLPECVRIVRGWTGHPFMMMAELDRTFGAVVYVGYHARAGSAGNPLAHTLSGRMVRELRVNGVPVSEFLLNTYTAASVGVPVAFLSGDTALCAEVKEFNHAIVTVATMTGVGTGTVSIHPETACREIRRGVEAALTKDLASHAVTLPPSFKIDIDYVKPPEAYRRSFYPGAERTGEYTVSYSATAWFDCLRMIHFCV